MTDRELMRQALEALQKIYIAPEHEEYIRVWWPACEDAIAALRERLAQPGQAEREACAVLVEQMGVEGYGTLAIAAAIRERGKR